MASLGEYELKRSHHLLSEYERIPDLGYSVVNSTSVMLNWTAPSIPTFNNFTLTSYKIQFWSPINPSAIQTIAFRNTTTTTYLVAGLGIWTQYEADIFYIGTEYILRAKEMTFRTGEDGEFVLIINQIFQENLA